MLVWLYFTWERRLAINEYMPLSDYMWAKSLSGASSDHALTPCGTSHWSLTQMMQHVEAASWYALCSKPSPGVIHFCWNRSRRVWTIILIPRFYLSCMSRVCQCHKYFQIKVHRKATTRTCPIGDELRARDPSSNIAKIKSLESSKSIDIKNSTPVIWDTVRTKRSWRWRPSSALSSSQQI